MNRYFNRDNSLLVIAVTVLTGLICLLLAEQLLTGWIALGERANISRRDINIVEWAVIVVGLAWSMITLWAAWDTYNEDNPHQVDDYFKTGQLRGGVVMSIALFIGISIVLLVIAEQVATGWLALGERANISRRDLNLTEWAVIAGAGGWAIVNARTALGFLTRRRPAHTWGEWVTLISAVIAVAIVYDNLLNVDNVKVDAWEDIAKILWQLGPGVVLFLSSMVVYRFLTTERTATPDEIIRNTLADTPAAGAIIATVVIFVAFALATSLFIEPRSLAGMLSNNATSGIIAIGITMLMISGEFDLSVGSIYGVSALVFLLMLTEGVNLLGVVIPPQPVIPSALIGVAAGILLGLINGTILIQTGIPSFIVTLGTMLVYRAIPLVVVEEGKILRYADYRLPPPTIYTSPWVIIVGAFLVAVVVGVVGLLLLRNYGLGLVRRINAYSQDTHDLKDFFLFMSLLRVVLIVVVTVGIVAFFIWAAVNQLEDTEDLVAVRVFDIANGQVKSFPLIGDFPADVNLRVGVLWWLLLVLLFQFILTQTPYGSYTYAVGGNPGASRAQGVSVTRIKLINFMLVGGLAGVAGLLNVARVTSVNANLGEGLELDMVAAAVIGGTLLTGGYGSVFGALLGVLIAAELRTGLVLVGVDPRIIDGARGAIIILAVVINTVVRRKKS